jgi:hypothetical protein
MSPHCPRILAGFLLSVLATGCRSDNEASKADSAAALPAPPAPVVPPAGNTGWEDSVAGPVLLLSHLENSQLAAVAFPSLTDSALAHGLAPAADTIAGMSFDLFDRFGKAGTARILSRAVSAPAEGCVSWPVVTFEDSLAKTWRIGLQRGMATPLALDSLEGANSADSISMTTELARLASALPASNDPAFQGLPFAVRKAYRSKIGETSILIGDIVRKINEEANPREERLLLIAESNSGGAYSTMFHSRAAGSEENVRTNDILAAVRFLKGKRVALVVAFEYENGSRIALIERRSGAGWKLTWRSAYAGC